MYSNPTFNAEQFGEVGLGSPTTSFHNSCSTTSTVLLLDFRFAVSFRCPSVDSTTQSHVRAAVMGQSLHAGKLSTCQSAITSRQTLDSQHAPVPPPSVLGNIPPPISCSDLKATGGPNSQRKLCPMPLLFPNYCLVHAQTIATRF